MDELTIDGLTKEQAMRYVDNLCRRIADKGKRKKAKRELLYYLRNKYGAVV